MKIKKKKIITAWTLMVAIAMQPLLASCQQAETDDPQPAPKQPEPLQLTSGITTAVTRAFDATWEASDQIGVFTVVAGSTSATDITYSGTQQDANIPYILTSTSAVATAGTTYTGFSSTTPIYLPIDGSNVDVYAYYPYDNTASAAGKSITLPTTQTLANQKTCDLMTAKALSSTSAINIDNTTASLLFQHVLTKVLIVVKVGTGYSSSDLTGHTAVKLTGLPITATFLPLTQALTVTSGTNDIVPVQLSSGDPDYSKLGDGVYIYRALVLPNSVATGSALSVSGNTASASNPRGIEFTIGSGTNTATYDYTINDTSYPFVAGEEIKFTLTLQATGVTITAAITPWSENSTVPETPIYEQ